MSDEPRKRIKRSCLAAAVVIAVCYGGGLRGVVSANPTQTSGEIKANATWSGEVLVTGDVLVGKNVTLTIQAGTTITFTDRKDDQNLTKGQPLDQSRFQTKQTRRAELLVEGTLIATGTETNPIRFTGDGKSGNAKLPNGQWGGIVILGTATPTVLTYLFIAFAEIGITIDNASTIENSTIMGSSGSLCDLTFARNPVKSDVRIGVNLRGAGGSIVRNNQIWSNMWGIHANTGGIQTDSILIEDNNIFLNTSTNTGFAVANGIHIYQARTDIILNWISNNYWGIEVSKSIVNVKWNTFRNNKYGFVWYVENDEATCKKSYLRENIHEGQKKDYVKQVGTNAPADLPPWWFLPST